MQGDIVQLESVVFQSHEPRDMEYRPQVTQIADVRPSSAQVAIYNEDDLSHLLFAGVDPAQSHTLVHDGKTTIDHTSQDHYSVLLEHSSGTHTPASETNESAVLSDCESEEDEYVLPPSPIRPRGGSICSDNIEFPIFLGRQGELSAASSPVQSPTAPKASLSCSAESGQVTRVKIVPAEHHVWKIDGPMMSWWPAPLETMEHGWTETKVRDEKQIPRDQHVSSIEGPMMTWWPPLEYEWSDVFYE